MQQITMRLRAPPVSNIPSRKWFGAVVTLVLFCFWSSMSSLASIASIETLGIPKTTEERRYAYFRRLSTSHGPITIRTVEHCELLICSKLLVQEFYDKNKSTGFCPPSRRLQANFNDNDQKHIMLLVEDENGQVCGYCDLDGRENKGFEGSKPRPYLSDLAVAAARRRRGFGTRLVRQAEAIARGAWGRDRLYLTVDQDNDSALKFYQKLGYVQASSGWDKNKQMLLCKYLGRPCFDSDNNTIATSRTRMLLLLVMMLFASSM